MDGLETQCAARGLAPVEWQWPGSAARCEARRGVDTDEPALIAVQFAILLTGVPLLLLQVHAMRLAAHSVRRSPKAALLGGLPSLTCLSLNVLSSLLWLFGDGHRVGFGTVITAAQACALVATFAGMRLLLGKMLELHRNKLNTHSLGPVLVTAPFAEQVCNAMVLASLLAAVLPFAASLRAWLAAHALIYIVAVAIFRFEMRMMLRNLYEFRRLTAELPCSQQDPKLMRLINYVIRSLTMMMRAMSVCSLILVILDGLGAITPQVYECFRVINPCAFLASNLLMSWSAVASIRKRNIKRDGAASTAKSAVHPSRSPSTAKIDAHPSRLPSTVMSAAHPSHSPPPRYVHLSSPLTPAVSPTSQDASAP
jgi:hypothetical protein